MQSEPVGVGLIGAGMIGQGHAYALRLLAEDGEVRPVAVTDFSSRRRRRGARRSARSSASRPTRKRSSTTPTSTRSSSSRRRRRTAISSHAVVDAGKPLLCEKPLATSFDVVREMCDAVAASGLTAQVGFHSRFHPLINELVRLVASERARRADGLHAARRPVLADRRRRSGPQLVALAARARGRRRAARALDPQRRHPGVALRAGDERLRAHAQRVRLRRRGHRGLHDRARRPASSAR